MKPRIRAARGKGATVAAPASDMAPGEATAPAGTVTGAGQGGPSAGLSSAGALGADLILGRVETAVLVVDHDGAMHYANPFAVELFGYADAPSLTAVAFRDLGFEQDDLSKVDALERQACRGKDWEGTLAIRRPDGSSLFVRMTASALRDDAGKVAGTVIMARRAVQLGGPRGDTERVGLLDRIGERLSGSLEPHETLNRVAQTLVPQFADHCFIDLYEGDGLLRKLVRKVLVNAWDWVPGEGTWTPVGAEISYPPGHFCRLATDQRDTILVEDLRDHTYPAPTADSLRASRDVGMTSVIAAPLRARGQDLGVMCLALSSLTPRETEHYAADDRDLVAAIASRVAIAIDNALLFEEERNTALAFQDSLLPSKPPVLDGIEVAYRYVPAKPLESHGQGIQTQVGGDWYDIISLSAGRVGIVIGDVVGRGAKAAAIMGQLRSALRAFAQDDKAPAEILRRLDEWCRAMTDERDESVIDSLIVSCTYLIYDPWFRELTIANAGHMSPLTVTADGVQSFDIEEGVLLGAGMPTYREETRKLAAGSTLIFYTDGLVDRRQRADGPGLYEDSEVFGMLGDAIMSVAGESVDKIAAAAEDAVPGQIDDDMAILVIRTAQDDLLYWDQDFPAVPIKVSEARKIAFDTFIECGMDDDQADLACLLVSEVVTNVVLHTSVAPSPRHEMALEPVGKGRAGGPAGVGAADDDWADSPFAAGFGFAPGQDGALPGQQFNLRIRKGQDAVWVEVFDSDLRLPRIRTAGENDEGGRGLYLVDQLAERWGSRPTDDGKAVWFKMPIRSGTAAP